MGGRHKNIEQRTLGTSISGWTRALMLGLQSMGVDGPEIFRSCGLNPADQGKSLVRIDAAKMQYVWQVAEQHVQDKARLAESVVSFLHAGSFPGLGFGLYASESIRDLFERLGRYATILSNAVEISVTVTAKSVSLQFVDRRDIQSYLTNVVGILYVLRVCRELAGPSIVPREIRAPWRNEEYVSALRIYGVNQVKRQNDEIMLVYERSEAERSLPSANAQLSAYQDRFCEDYISTLDELAHLPMRVKVRITHELARAGSSIVTTANSFNMSPRTLQRKLRDLGTCYREILKEVRQELALEYTIHTEMSATQIAYLLGFSGLTQFSQAYRDWFGGTLRERRSALR